MPTSDQPAEDGGFRDQNHSFRADGLGLPAFPVGAGPGMDLGEHIMGVVVIAWLTHLPVSQWGPAWVSAGEMDVQFRAHLTTGRLLTAEVTRETNHLEMLVRGIDGNVAATATASMARGGADLGATHPIGPASDGKVAPVHDLLRDREFSPVTFEFDADRDLAFTAGIPDGEVWRSRGWAHPAWLACGTNALVRQNVDFGTPGWTNAGIGIRNRAPIEDGSAITLTGLVADMFDRGHHRFATAAITAWVEGRASASIRNTFVYETVG
jgi:hypothetical protein